MHSISIIVDRNSRDIPALEMLLNAPIWVYESKAPRKYLWWQQQQLDPMSSSQ